MTNQQALAALYLLADFERVRQNGHVCSADWFWHQGVVIGLMSEPRRVAARLVRRASCIACGEPLAPDSTGDHVIARKNGGPPGLGNYLPLCGRCNSSKGTRDLLAWWRQRGRRACELPADVLTVYSRLMFRQHADRETHNAPAPTYLRESVEELVRNLPTPEHEWVLRRRVGTVTGRTFVIGAPE
jgi:hypothetical protein